MMRNKHEQLNYAFKFKLKEQKVEFAHNQTFKITLT